MSGCGAVSRRRAARPLPHCARPALRGAHPRPQGATPVLLPRAVTLLPLPIVTGVVVLCSVRFELVQVRPQARAQQRQVRTGQAEVVPLLRVHGATACTHRSACRRQLPLDRRRRPPATSAMSARRRPPVHRPSSVRVADRQLAVLVARVAGPKECPVPVPDGNRTANAVVLVVVAITVVGIANCVLATGRSDNPVLFVGDRGRAHRCRAGAGASVTARQSSRKANPEGFGATGCIESRHARADPAGWQERASSGSAPTRD